MAMTFDNLCKKDAEPGYALDHAIAIYNETIIEARGNVYCHIKQCIDKLTKESKRVVKPKGGLYIGKSHICRRKGVDFDPNKCSTWILNDGINSRYGVHKKKDYGRSGLVVVAVVTRESIPDDCQKKRIHHTSRRVCSHT